MSKEELTAEQKMEIAIAKAKESRKKAKDEAKLKLLDNNDYIEYLASTEEESEEIAKLTGLMDTLNKMKPIVANDGTKYSVNAFPIAEYIFGPVMARVLSLINVSSAMFTDERQAEFEVVTGISYLSATKARNAIGNPAYYSKGVLTEAIQGNKDDLTNAITAVCVALDVDISYANKANQANIDKWFTVAESKAQKQFSEFNKLELVDQGADFILED